MSVVPPPGVVFAPPPLPPGWTEHKAPSGHTYYYHAATKQSTYTRPLPPIHLAGPLPGPPPPFPPAAPALVAEPAAAPAETSDATEKKSKKSKKEKPLTKTPVPGTEWLRVVTTLGNVFFTHTGRKESVWTCPEEIAEAVAEMEREEERLKAEAKEREEREKAELEAKEKEEREKAEVERIKRELEALGVKRKAEEEGEKSPKRPRVEDENEEGPASKGKPQVLVPPVFAVPDQVKLDPEEARALFTTLLNEVSPNPLLPYDQALPQLVNDARYVLLAPNERKSVFDEWCKERARNLRKNKLKEASTTPEAAYEGLLRAEVKSTRTTWDDFRRKWKKDRRFYDYGRDDKEREKKFRSWLVELGEVKRKEAKKAEDGFIELLKTVDDVTPNSEWKDVKRGIAQDSRYDAVGSATRREELFNKFKSTLSHTSAPVTTPDQADKTDKTGTEKESKSARRERALKERESQVRAAQTQVERDIGQSKGRLGKEEAEREFGTVLTDAIRDPLVTWDAALAIMDSDPRFQHAAQVLPPAAQRALFGVHIDHASTCQPNETKANDKDDTDDEDDPDKPSRRDKLDRGLADEFAKWQRARGVEARLAFDAMLGENSFVEFWGRLAKIGGEGVEGGVPAEEGEEEDEGEGGGGKVDMKALAKNVDVSEMEKVLRHDARYTVFDHIPEQREQWIRDYLSQQTAPKLSVHAYQSRA
ncbi:transcription elongation regulator 1 [Ceratobasidium sp. AG-Ba]|nr:transcription elongation regulator 1 [Ceratobasidium sp. AG-Ba]